MLAQAAPDSSRVPTPVSTAVPAGVDLWNSVGDMDTGPERDPEFVERGTTAGVGIRSFAGTQREGPPPEEFTQEALKGRIGGEKGDFAQFMENDASRRGFDWKQVDTEAANMAEGAIRGLGRTIAYIPEETISLFDATVGEIGRKLGLWEGSLPRHFIDRWANSQDYEQMKQLVEFPEGIQAFKNLHSGLQALTSFGTGERVGFTGGGGKTGEIIGEFAGIGLTQSAIARELSKLVYKAPQFATRLSRTGEPAFSAARPPPELPGGGVKAMQTQLQREFQRDLARTPGLKELRPPGGGPPVFIRDIRPGVYPMRVNPQGGVEAIGTPAALTVAQTIGRGARLTGAEFTQLASRHPVADAVMQVKYGTLMGGLYGVGEAAFPDWENAGAYFSMSPLLVPAVVMGLRGAIPQVFGVGKKTITGTASAVKNYFDEKGIVSPAADVISEALASTRINTPMRVNKKTGELELQTENSYRDQLRFSLRQLGDKWNPRTPGGSQESLEQHIEQILPLLDTPQARANWERTKQIDAMYRQAMWNAYKTANPRASADEIEQAVKASQFEWSLGEQHLERNLLAEQARIETQAQGTEANDYLLRKAQNHLKAENFRLAMRGGTAEELDAAPTFIYDNVSGQFEHVVLGIDTDLKNVATMLEQLSAPGTVRRGVRPDPAELAKQRAEQAAKAIPVTPEGEALFAGEGIQARFPEAMPLTAGEEAGTSLRQIVQELRSTSESFMDDFATTLGINRYKDLMGRMQPVKDALLESTDLAGWVGRGSNITEAYTWNALPDQIKHLLSNKATNMDFGMWKQYRSQISTSIRGYMLRGDKGNAQHLITLKARLDDMMWGVNGKAATPGRFAEWATKYDDLVLQPFETMPAAKIRQTIGGTRAASEMFFYQIPEEQVASTFINNTESLKAFQGLFGPKGLKYAAEGVQWNPREYQLLRDAILDNARPHVLVDGTLSPDKIRAYLNRGNNRAVFREAIVPDPVNPQEMVTMESIFENSAKVTEAMLGRQQLLNSRMRNINSLELNKVFQQFAGEQGTAGFNTADAFIDRAMQNPRLMRRLHESIQATHLDPAGIPPAEYAAANAQHQNNLQRALNDSIFSRFSAKEMWRADNPSKFENPYLGFKAQGSWLSENQGILIDAMGQEHFNNMVVLNEVMKRVYATYPQTVGAGLSTNILTEAFERYTGVTLQGYSARLINMLEGRIGPRTSAVWLGGQAFKAGQLRRLDAAMKELMMNPTLTRLVTQRTINPGEVSVMQANRIRSALWWAGIPDLTQPPTTTIQLEYGISDTEFEPAPEPVTEPTPEPTAAITPPAGPPTAALAPRGRSLQPAGPSAGPPAGPSAGPSAGPTDFATLFPYDELGQAVARRDQGGIRSLRG